MIDRRRLDHRYFVGQKSLVDRAARLLIHDRRIGDLGHGPHLQTGADRRVTSHIAVDQALDHELCRTMVNDNRQLALLAQHAVSVLIRCAYYVLEATGDIEAFELGEDRPHGVVVRVGIEVEVDFETRRRYLLHGRGLVDDVLDLVDVILDPPIPPARRLPDLFGHGGRLLRHGPGADRDPGAQLATHQLPRRQLEVPPHQIVERHVDPQVRLGIYPVEGVRVDVFLAQLVAIRARTPALAQALKPRVGVQDIHGAVLQRMAVIARQRRGVEVLIGRQNQMHFQVGYTHSSYLYTSAARRANRGRGSWSPRWPRV